MKKILLALMLSGCMRPLTPPLADKILDRCMTEYDVLKPTLSWPIIDEMTFTSSKTKKTGTVFVLRNPKNTGLHSAVVWLKPGTREIEYVHYLRRDAQAVEMIYKRVDDTCFILKEVL
jgi:hypothetical protein